VDRWIQSHIYLSACCAAGYTWFIIGGSLPPGLSLSPGGALSGTLSTAGTYTFLVSAADTGNASNAGYRQFVMTVTPIGLTSATTLPYGNVGSAYNQTSLAAGGAGALSWTLAPFNYLPAGLSLSSNGNISGTPTQTGQFEFTINVTDAAGNSDTWSFTIAVYAAPETRFVAPNGSDSNPGTLSQPYLTIQRCATDLLLTDVVMPGLNGRELSDRLKELRPDLKVLFISGYTADVIANRGVLDPGFAFLHKPFSLEELAVKVRAVLAAPSNPTVQS